MSTITGEISLHVPVSNTQRVREKGGMKRDSGAGRRRQDRPWKRLLKEKI